MQALFVNKGFSIFGNVIHLERRWFCILNNEIFFSFFRKVFQYQQISIIVSAQIRYILYRNRENKFWNNATFVILDREISSKAVVRWFLRFLFGNFFFSNFFLLNDFLEDFGQLFPLTASTMNYNQKKLLPKLLLMSAFVC